MDVRVPRARRIPSDMPLFTRGLASVGARVIGVGDQHADALPHRVREALTDYIQIDNWFDEDGTVATVLRSLRAATSTSSRRCGSRSSSPPPGCARRSACPGSTCARR